MNRVLLLFLTITLIFFAQVKCARETRLTGDLQAKPGQFPYQVSFRNHVNKHICGGSILNSKWILTAASSLDESQPENIKIVVGSTLLDEGGIEYKLKQIRLHPEFDNVTLENDIALVETINEIEFGEFVQPIKLVDQKELFGEVVLSGWGRVSTNGNIPNNLMYLITEIFPHEKCALKITVNKDTLCTFTGAGTGSCFGDTGSPLVVPGYGQVGVNSFVVGGCGNGYPDGYTSVFYHRDWILSNIA
uniref:CSON005566 protein n=1 Tax=Culicoides sonorensis TaxID=179676 RepID=A0A336KAP2_CULSO